MLWFAIISVLFALTSVHVVGVFVALPGLGIALLTRFFRRQFPADLTWVSTIIVGQADQILVMLKVLNSLQIQGVRVARVVRSMHVVGRIFNLIITDETMRSKPKLSIPWSIITCRNEPFRIPLIELPCKISILLRGTSAYEPRIRVLSYVFWRALENAKEQGGLSIVATLQ